MARVLFVDDSAVARARATDLLRQHGVDVTALGSSEEASRVDVTPLAAALLDIELGDGLGTDLAARLRRESPALPIAFLTAGAPAATLDVATKIGPVFSKSVGIDEAIEWVLGRVGLG